MDKLDKEKNKYNCDLCKDQLVILDHLEESSCKSCKKGLKVKIYIPCPKCNSNKKNDSNN